MSDDHVFDLLVLLHGIPHFTQVFPVLVRDGTEVWLGMLGDICHPQLDEVIWQAFCLEVDAITLGVQVVENVWLVGHAHVCFFTVHEFIEIGFDSRVSTH